MTKNVKDVSKNDKKVQKMTKLTPKESGPEITSLQFQLVSPVYQLSTTKGKSKLSPTAKVNFNKSLFKSFKNK